MPISRSLITATGSVWSRYVCQGEQGQINMPVEDQPHRGNPRSASTVLLFSVLALVEPVAVGEARGNDEVLMTND
jgi:hypothetical protein